MPGAFPQGLDLRSTGDIISKALQANQERARTGEAFKAFNDATNPMTSVPAPTSSVQLPTPPGGVPYSPMQVRGVPTQERQPIDPGSPEFQSATTQYLNEVPEGGAMMSAAEKIQQERLPKQIPVNQEAGGAGLFTIPPPGKGEPTYKELHPSAFRPGAAKEIPVIKPGEDGQPHKFISSWDAQGGYIGERDMGIDQDAITRALKAKNSGAGAAQLDPAAAHAMAEDMLLTGKPPAMGMGGAAMRAMVYNEYGKLANEQGLDAQARQVISASTTAEQRNLANILKQRSMILTFEKTAERNLNIALAQSGIVDRFGAPVFNRWKLYAQGQYGGDPEVAKFDAAVRVAANEIAKVTATTTGNLVPQQEREEYNKLLSTALNVEQFKGVTDILKKDMESRKVSYDSEISDIKENFPALMNSVPAPGATKPGANARPKPKLF